MTVTLLGRPTFPAGPVAVVCGNRGYWAPEGTRVARTKASRKQLSYLLLPTGELHAVTASGEVEIPVSLKQSIMARYFSP